MLKLDVSTFLTCPNMSRYFWRFEHLGGKIHMCSAEAEEVGCLRFEVGFWGWQFFSTKRRKKGSKEIWINLKNEEKYIIRQQDAEFQKMKILRVPLFHHNVGHTFFAFDMSTWYVCGECMKAFCTWIYESVNLLFFLCFFQASTFLPALRALHAAGVWKEKKKILFDESRRVDGHAGPAAVRCGDLPLEDSDAIAPRAARSDEMRWNLRGKRFFWAI